MNVAIGSLTVVLLCIQAGAAPRDGQDEAAPARKVDEARGRGPRLELTLAPVGRPRRDRVVLKVTVKNDGNAPVAWDREYAAFLRWTVEADEGVAIRAVHVAEVPRPTPADLKSRFTTIGPGRTLTTEIELTKAVRCFASGHSDQHAPTGYEELVRFAVPPSTAALRVRAEYAIGFDDLAGFSLWFGREVRDVGLWQGRSPAARLTIDF